MHLTPFCLILENMIRHLSLSVLIRSKLHLVLLFKGLNFGFVVCLQIIKVFSNPQIFFFKTLAVYYALGEDFFCLCLGMTSLCLSMIDLCSEL